MNAHDPNMKTEKSGFPNSDSRFGRADYNLAPGQPARKPAPEIRKVMSELLEQQEVELREANGQLEVQHAQLNDLTADIADMTAKRDEAKQQVTALRAALSALYSEQPNDQER
ncbi:putative secreted protein Streptputative secreted protein [Roseibium sp. TrichSKD4]|uniref:hypothetical protein n=1 Tax=Roseibium sp. TrichSKD4 TaxID=744980 RepID=UPI0001E56BD3|nr:hypothetical protein [Roseibium sp. TrichSKD4]EFO30143.1 putative secreted protein Streptputative secreted protein [Roseibium sp. TrichSKD4]